VLGAEPEPITAANVLAIQVWNHLADRNGSIDWAGLPFIAELLGVDDIESLVDALLVIKTRPVAAADPDPEPDPQTD
jgi:hypothetical protein